jgi:hypothetical protein
MRDDVKFFLRNVEEISVRDYSREVWLHVALAPAIAVIGIAILVFATKSDRAADQTAASGSATKVTSASR